MRIVSVVGTRPQLIKHAALQPALRAVHEEVFVDTGQHYDSELAGNFFQELDLPKPDFSLEIRGSSQAEQVGRLMISLEPILRSNAPDAVLVYGDTNSTLAGGLAAAKLDLAVAHVEAGMRSFDRRMPEELNRVLVDHLSTWLFAPTSTAVANLRAEGLTSGVIEVGDVMQDLAASVVERIRDPAVLDNISKEIGLASPLRPGRYLFATLHRAENRSPVALGQAAGILAAVSGSGLRTVLALHPGTARALDRERIEMPPHVAVIQPVGYRTSLALQLHARAVLTDSGGIQREANWLGTPCLVMRMNTEWVETLGTDRKSRLIALDRDLALRELESLAPAHTAAAAAATRAAGVDVNPSRAVPTIVAALAR